MTIAGIDVSSFAVDVVLLDEEVNLATAHRFDLNGETPFARTRSLRSVFPTRSFWEDAGVFLVGLEDPHSRFPHVAKAMGVVTGGVAALLPRDLVVIQTPPKEWKRIFCGDANASKEAVIVAAQALGFPDGERVSKDAYDAYAIAWAVRALNSKAIQRGAA